MRPLISSALVLLCLVCFAPPALAGPIILNGSFELGPTSIGTNITLGLGYGSSTAIPGWVVSAGNIELIGSLWQSSDGSRNIDLNGEMPGAISQTFDTLAGGFYEVLFDLAGNPGGGPTIKTLRVSAAGGFTDYTFDVTGKSFSNMGWTEQLFSFTAVGPKTTLEVLTESNLS
jgi:choice-of-anchor C domain-containing protein